MAAAFCLAPIAALVFGATAARWSPPPRCSASPAVEGGGRRDAASSSRPTSMRAGSFVPAARLTRALSYLQLAFSFLRLRLVHDSAEAARRLGDPGATTLAREAWTLANPAAWFAALDLLASGERTPFMAMARLLSLAGAGRRAWRWSAAGCRSTTPNGSPTMATTPPRRAGRRGRRRPLAAGRVFANGEARAVAVLVRAQFRHDNRFRLTVLSIVPLTLVYMFSGFDEGGLDPFLGGRQGHTLVYMAVMMFPPMLRAALTQSDAYRAAWIFHGTPADKRALVMALQELRRAGVPGAVPRLPRRHLRRGRWAVRGWCALHVVLLGLISHLLLVVDLMLNPEVPFSRPVVARRPHRDGRSCRSSAPWWSGARCTRCWPRSIPRPSPRSRPWSGPGGLTAGRRARARPAPRDGSRSVRSSTCELNGPGIRRARPSPSR